MHIYVFYIPLFEWISWIKPIFQKKNINNLLTLYFTSTENTLSLSMCILSVYESGKAVHCIWLVTKLYIIFLIFSFMKKTVELDRPDFDNLFWFYHIENDSLYLHISCRHIGLRNCIRYYTLHHKIQQMLKDTAGCRYFVKKLFVSQNLTIKK